MLWQSALISCSSWLSNFSRDGWREMVSLFRVKGSILSSWGLSRASPGNDSANIASSHQHVMTFTHLFQSQSAARFLFLFSSEKFCPVGGETTIWHNKYVKQVFSFFFFHLWPICRTLTIIQRKFIIASQKFWRPRKESNQVDNTWFDAASELFCRFHLCVCGRACRFLGATGLVSINNLSQQFHWLIINAPPQKFHGCRICRDHNHDLSCKRAVVDVVSPWLLLF